MSSSNKLIDQLLDGLRSQGVKITRPEKKGLCSEAIAMLETGQTRFLYIYPGKYTNKPIIIIAPTKQDCLEALYTPTNHTHIPLDNNPTTLHKKLKNHAKLHQKPL
ncbi:MAG: hypothetical protein GSR81_03015 [Desulfurococcales archaeon]|nr:hypothetical protein [Desulfurococcales archaeon]